MEVGLTGMEELHALRNMDKSDREEVFHQLQRYGMTYFQSKVLDVGLRDAFPAGV